MDTTRNPGGQQDPLAVALECAGRGWLVFPLHSLRGAKCTCPRGAACPQKGKHPWTRNGFKAGTTDRKIIRRWWQAHPEANVGIVTGEASGVLVIDIDPRNGGDATIEDLIRRLGELPPAPVVKTGGGGRHIFVQYPGGKVKKPAGCAGIDIKSDGGYVVGAGSIHASGRTYCWLVSPEQEPLPALPDSWLAWLTSGCYTSDPCYTSDASYSSDSANALIVRGSAVADSALSEYIHKAIEKTAPGNVGRRRNRLFHFLKRLREHPELKDKPVQAIRPHVQKWHRRAYPKIGTKPFADTWQDAVGAWQRIDDREGLLRRLFRQAQQEERPGTIIRLDYEDEPIVVGLVVLCRALQRHHGDKPFFLGYHQAAETVGTDAMTAMRRMKMMEADGVIKLTAKGGHKEGRANEYRYLGD